MIICDCGTELKLGMGTWGVVFRSVLAEEDKTLTLFNGVARPGDFLEHVAWVCVAGRSVKCSDARVIASDARDRWA